ncbi:MAG: asparaginase [Fidelibacterota bacterium]
MCKILRGEFIESIHVVYAVVVDGNGQIIRDWGDPYYLTCVRSSLKPFQASASVAEGSAEAAGFTTEELALMCASHNGEDIHVKTAKGMLEKLGYNISNYECGKHLPYDRETKTQLIKHSKNASPLHNNCSGKHAGMLCLSKFLKAEPNGYTNPKHPVQKSIMAQVKKYSELSEFPIAIDGCSAPTPFMPLYNIALMFQKLAGGQYPELNILFDAMVSHPYLIAGKNRFDTDFTEVMNGRAVTKVGGEAVRGLGIRNKNGGAYGIALKVLDGNQRCSPQAAIAILEEMDLLSKDELNTLNKYSKTTLKNHRKLNVGSIEVEIH